MGELMSHSAGFTYGLFGNTPVDKLYQADNPLEAPSLQAFIDKMATLPLLYQPGHAWVYSVSVDIQGYLVEKLSGKTFPEFLRTRLFEPLGMIDTGFFVPAEKLSRVATIYAYDQAKARARGRAARSGDHDDAWAAVRRRRSLFDGRRLLPLRADAAERRRIRTASGSSRRAPST